MNFLKLLFCVGFLLSANTLRAQENIRRHSLALQWGVYIPSSGGFLNHTTSVTPSLEWDWRIAQTLSVGAEVGYTHGVEHNYTQDRYEGDLVTGQSDRRLTLVPLTIHFRWSPVSFAAERLRPFIGFGTGAQYAVFRIRGEMINESKVQSWGAIVRPEAGIGFSPRHDGRIGIELKCGWQWAANRLPILSIRSLQGVQISAGVRYRF